MSCIDCAGHVSAGFQRCPDCHRKRVRRPLTDAAKKLPDTDPLSEPDPEPEPTPEPETPEEAH